MLGPGVGPYQPDLDHWLDAQAEERRWSGGALARRVGAQDVMTYKILFHPIVPFTSIINYTHSF
jgi:hypothetical protein